MRHWLVMATFVLGSTALACGSGDASSGSDATGKQAVTGTVARSLDNSRAIAVTPTGKTYWSYLDKNGNFSLAIPAGTAFRLIVTNGLPAGGQKVIGRLAIHTSAGTSAWMTAPSGTLALGTLRPAGTTTTSGTKTLSETPETSGDHESAPSTKSGDDGDHEHDGDCHEDEHEDEGVCSAKAPEREEDDDVELDADHDPGDRCKDDDAREHEERDDADEKEEKGDKKPCGGGGSASGSDAGAGGGGGGTTPTTTGGGGGGASTPPAPTNVGIGGACNASANCAAGLACVASKCSVK